MSKTINFSSLLIGFKLFCILLSDNITFSKFVNFDNPFISTIALFDASNCTKLVTSCNESKLVKSLNLIDNVFRFVNAERLFKFLTLLLFKFNDSKFENTSIPEISVIASLSLAVADKSRFFTLSEFSPEILILYVPFLSSLEITIFANLACNLSANTLSLIGIVILSNFLVYVVPSAAPPLIFTVAKPPACAVIINFPFSTLQFVHSKSSEVYILLPFSFAIINMLGNGSSSYMPALAMLLFFKLTLSSCKVLIAFTLTNLLLSAYISFKPVIFSNSPKLRKLLFDKYTFFNLVNFPIFPFTYESIKPLFSKCNSSKFVKLQIMLNLSSFISLLFKFKQRSFVIFESSAKFVILLFGATNVFKLLNTDKPVKSSISLPEMSILFT